MLKKLASDGYVEQIARGEVRLTRKGLEVGVRVLRRHRLAERLLTDVLGMGWDEVDTEACMLEHAISDNVEKRLVEFLGDPQTCPHGHPIPPKDLSEPVRHGTPLAQLEAGSSATVCGVTEDVPEILRYLAEVGLRPGVAVIVQQKAPLGGPITVKVREREYPISLELARMVMVDEERPVAASA
jgi:DtxR family Mn-dependent transcriptional regulator